jgi:Fur family ferric uptake transcriptional regulator
MASEAETVQLLRQMGYKLTPQRLMVLSVVQHQSGHRTAAQIFERVKETYPYVDISTVYRTMAVLKELKLVNETDMGTGDTTYEWAGREPHHHLICRACGAVASLDHEYMARLGAELLTVYGFRADLDHFAIFGYCSHCVEEQADDDHRSVAVPQVLS